MKGNRKLLYVALAGLLTAFFASGALGFDPGPNGNGGGGDASNGTQNQAQNHQCCPGVVEVLGIDLEYIGTKDQTRARDGSCGGEPGPNQNPEPGWGPPE